jgi:uncharacterized membrane protein
VPSDFLPPDPHADAPQDAGRVVFVPPNAPLEGEAGRGRQAGRSGGGGRGARAGPRAVAALALATAGLGLLVFSIGALFVLTLPASIAGWILGRQAQRSGAKRDQANVAVTIGIVGTVLGVIAAVAWILITSFTDWTPNPEHD